jgi:hypothetical protein
MCPITNMNRILISITLFFLPLLVSAKPDGRTDCSISLDGNNLIIENSRIRRTYAWNDGNVATLEIANKRTGKVWRMDPVRPDLMMPGVATATEGTQYRIYDEEKKDVLPFHKCIEISYRLGSLEVRRILRIYPESPAVVADYYFRGTSSAKWNWPDDFNYKTKENIRERAKVGDIVSVENLDMPGRQWMTESVALTDKTDANNNMVIRRNDLAYITNFYEGNVMIARSLEAEQGLFFIKEAPAAFAQLNYPGADYAVNFGQISMLGTGLSDALITPDKWTRGYSSIVGVFGEGEYECYKSILEYQRSCRAYVPERDDMIMSNTWGDGNRDSKISEAFILKELEAASVYGIRHYQIDDGWQQGLSLGSAMKTGNKKWDSWTQDDWEPNKERFPNGWSKIIKSAKSKNIELGLWFNPSKVNDFAGWEKDADIVINIYRKYGIRYFKIDGMQIVSKKAEENYISFLEKIKSETAGKVIFNLDVTFGKRLGFLYHADYGSIFVENRYSHRAAKHLMPNYYPFHTLRNLWNLSRFVPAQNLLIEMANKWNSTDKYGDDKFAPINYDIKYLFAITMIAQPLFWLEPSSLPQEALSLAPVVKKYGQHQSAIHKGIILPIGEDPSGSSWTGFQSVNGNKGYILVLREYSKFSKNLVKTAFPANRTVRLEPVLGEASRMTVKTTEKSEIEFSLPSVNSFALYSYTISE